ncbi:hypothetical protein [Photorhabdus bodei]|uniref:Uncharacterized protein n=1 Tax=Photorhabdus bodei TaxID=2029681 RepID=A0AAW6BPB7_9GAMM|nr:hypothetical protein [Photorhabdus bodei]MDB6373849.1 hypothetical protein [Photorhabdus bodei]
MFSLVKVATVDGMQETLCLASFSRLVSGVPERFLVTRSIDDLHHVVTHEETGWMVCPIDLLSTTLEGVEKSGSDALNDFIGRYGEIRLAELISSTKKDLTENKYPKI